MTKTIALLGVLLTGISTSAAAATELNFGRFVISVSDSWTAQVFHIVDQLSAWDPAVHLAYSRWARDAKNLDDQDRRLLARHAELRRARGWGPFEQAFLVEDSIEMAATKALQAGLLSPDEAAAEREILEHFAPKLVVLRDQQRVHVEAFQARLTAERDRLAPIIEKLVRFSEMAGTINVPIFLVVNPEERSGGGRATGGRIVVEVPAPDPFGALIHESLHALLAGKAATIRAAAEQAGLSFGALNEGLAYAMAPGLTDDPTQADALAEQLARSIVRGTPASDGYVQSGMVAVVLRPVLRAALERGETLTAFLPKAIDRWRTFSGR